MNKSSNIESFTSIEFKETLFNQIFEKSQSGDSLDRIENFLRNQELTESEVYELLMKLKNLYIKIYKSKVIQLFDELYDINEMAASLEIHPSFVLQIFSFIIEEAKAMARKNLRVLLKKRERIGNICMLLSNQFVSEEYILEEYQKIIKIRETKKVREYTKLDLLVFIELTAMLGYFSESFFESMSFFSHFMSLLTYSGLYYGSLLILQFIIYPKIPKDYLYKIMGAFLGFPILWDQLFTTFYPFGIKTFIFSLSFILINFIIIKERRIILLNKKTL